MRFWGAIGLILGLTGTAGAAQPLIFDIYDQYGWSCEKQTTGAPCLMPMLIATLAERSGVMLQHETVPIPRLGDRLRRGQAYFTLLSRPSEPGVAILGELLSVPLLAIGRRQGQQIRRFDDLYTLPQGVGMLLGTNYGSPMLADPRLPRVDVSDSVLGLRMLASGRLDALVGSQVTLVGQAREAQLTDKLGDRLVLGSMPFRLAVAEENRNAPATLAVLEAARAMQADGTVAALLDQVTNAAWAAR
ncbi:hypothetical protein ACFSM5_03800 [Lacibacterium aquatile]|uniref:Transporter substrate-binding domain-containing protein n=1 Tax=Lacibacterium aquatile TaxID=1168082 RepID=A0ABW5DLI9_9PROT